MKGNRVYTRSIVASNGINFTNTLLEEQTGNSYLKIGSKNENNEEKLSQIKKLGLKKEKDLS